MREASPWAELRLVQDVVLAMRYGRKFTAKNQTQLRV
jgi:hypothetical protein